MRRDFGRNHASVSEDIDRELLKQLTSPQRHLTLSQFFKGKEGTFGEPSSDLRKRVKNRREYLARLQTVDPIAFLALYHRYFPAEEDKEEGEEVENVQNKEQPESPTAPTSLFSCEEDIQEEEQQEEESPTTTPTSALFSHQHITTMNKSYALETRKSKNHVYLVAC